MLRSMMVERSTSRRSFLGLLLIPLIAAAVWGGLSLRSAENRALERLHLDGRLAVLPIVNATGDPALNWTTVGFSEMIAEAAARQSGIQVVSPVRVWETLSTRDLTAGDPATRPRARRLTRALGAGLLVDLTLRPSPQGRPDRYLLETTLYDAEDRVVAQRLLDEDDLAALGDRLLTILSESLAGDLLPTTLTGAFSPSPFAVRLYGMALAAMRTGDAERARDLFEVLDDSFPHFLQNQARLAETTMIVGRVRPAREQFLALLDASQGLGERRLQVVSLESLGRISARDKAANFEQAERSIRQALSIAVSLGDDAARLRLLRAMAEISWRRGAPSEARERWEERLALQREIGDRLGEIETLLSLARDDLAHDRIDEAESSLLLARDLSRGLGDLPTEVAGLWDLGNIAKRRGRLDGAEELWRQALEFQQRRGDAPQRIRLLRALADLALERDQRDVAEDLFLEILEAADRREDERLAAHASLRIARIQLQGGFPLQARQYLERALAADRLIDDPLELQRLIAWTAYEQGNYSLALETQAAVRRQAGDDWTSIDELFLEAYAAARRTGERQPLPTIFRPPASDPEAAPAAQNDDPSAIPSP